jgi:intein/homing endonuclease
MATWDSFYKLFQYAFTKDPVERRADKRKSPGVGVTNADAMPDVRQDGSFWGGSGAGSVRLHGSNEMIDLSTVTNRTSRYAEYERLRNVAEIERAMTLFADESCVAGDTLIATPAYGYKTIEWLAENVKDRFLVYCYDFEAEDYTLGWAFDPRVVKTAPTIKVYLDDGHELVGTEDHRVLLRTGRWTTIGQLKEGDELMPFYRIKANTDFNREKTNQYPRVWTHRDGWKHERHFINEWKTGRKFENADRFERAARMITGGLSTRQVAKLMGHQWKSIDNWLHKEGFSVKELHLLSKKADRRRVVGTRAWHEMKVYDLSVEGHENFCTDGLVLHNCQKDDEGNRLKIECANDEVREELEFLFLHRGMLNMNREIINYAKQLYVKGDLFLEICIDTDDPKSGIFKIKALPPETMYRIETTMGRLVEFQQAANGPDYECITRAPVATADDATLRQANVHARFWPDQIVHIRIGDDRKTFYPYGQSLIEPARGPAHQLRLMEDAMLVYRLCIRGYDKVLVPGGWKYMKDVTTADKVYTYNQRTGKVEFGSVAWHGLVGRKRTYKVRSRHTSLTGTSIHPVVVYDKATGESGYVKIKDLVPGRHFFVRPKIDVFEPKKINRFYKPKFAVLTENQRKKYKATTYASKKDLILEALADDGQEVSKSAIQKCWSFLIAGNSLPESLAVKMCELFGLGEPLRKNKGERKPARIDLPEYVTEEFASMFGFLLGDGCINWNKGSAKLLFAAGEYPALNEKYASLLKQFFGACRFQQDERLVKGLGNYCTNRATACEILQNMGFVGDARAKRIPAWVFTERPEIRKALIKGLADADGDKRGPTMTPWRSTIRLCNKALVEDAKVVWESLGYHASEVKKIDEPERVIKGAVVPAGESWEVYLSETEVPFHDEIVSVTRLGKEDVYDLTVEHPTEHNFLCNGVPVSNTRAPERRVFYLDVGQLPPFKAEAYIDRMKDQFRKKKVAGRTSSPNGNNLVEERWIPPAADEDYWIPVRQNSNTRVETLPGAQNLGEIDDAVYFRNKLLMALNVKPSQFAADDPQATRITMSARDAEFARLIERLQSNIEDGLWEVADRHLRLRGFPEECYEDLKINMTPPSDWRELSRAEVVTNRMNVANGLKGSQLMPDYDILTRWMKYSEDESKEMIGRMKIQKLEDLKLQVLAQNPTFLGVGIPGQDGQELGAEAGGPSPVPSPDGSPPPAGNEPPPGGSPPQGPPPGGSPPQGPPPGGSPPQGPPPGGSPPQGPPPQGVPLGDLDEDEIKRYDLEISSYSREQDAEDIDFSVGD